MIERAQEVLTPERRAEIRARLDRMTYVDYSSSNLLLVLDALEEAEARIAELELDIALALK